MVCAIDTTRTRLKLISTWEEDILPMTYNVLLASVEREPCSFESTSCARFNHRLVSKRAAKSYHSRYSSTKVPTSVYFLSDLLNQRPGLVARCHFLQASSTSELGLSSFNYFSQASRSLAQRSKAARKLTRKS
jgi:hypothetical protein